MITRTVAAALNGDTASPAAAVNPMLDTVLAIVTTVSLVLWIGIVRRLSGIQDSLAADGPQQLR